MFPPSQNYNVPSVSPSRGNSKHSRGGTVNIPGGGETVNIPRGVGDSKYSSGGGGEQ